jgi:hypothetical protein
MGSAKATALVVLALALAGCGADDAARDAREAVDPVAEAADRTAAAGGARIDGAAWFEYEGQMIEMTMDGVADFEDQRSSMTMTLPALTAREERESGLPLERLRDGLSIYASAPDLRARIGKRWAKIDIAEGTEGLDLDEDALAGWDESNPQQLLRFLEVAGNARPAGSERIGRKRTTRYDALVEVERYADHALGDNDDPDARAGFIAGLRESLGADSIPVSVWLDEEGLIRREEMVMPVELAPGESIEAKLVIDFEDFGPHHDVELPGDDDVEDVTDEFEQYREYFTG